MSLGDTRAIETYPYHAVFCSFVARHLVYEFFYNFLLTFLGL